MQKSGSTSDDVATAVPAADPVTFTGRKSKPAVAKSAVRKARVQAVDVSTAVVALPSLADVPVDTTSPSEIVASEAVPFASLATDVAPAVDAEAPAVEAMDRTEPIAADADGASAADDAAPVSTPLSASAVSDSTPVRVLTTAAPVSQALTGKDGTMTLETSHTDASHTDTAHAGTSQWGFTATDKSPVEKTQAMFADLTNRAKGAMEKSAAMIEDMNAFSKGNIEAIVESSKLAAKGAETLGHDAAAYAKSSFEGATEAMKTLAAAKSPTEFMKLHSDYVRTAFDTLIADSARSTETIMKMAGEITQPISNRVAIATEKLKLSA